MILYSKVMVQIDYGELQRLISFYEKNNPEIIAVWKKEVDKKGAVCVFGETTNHSQYKADENLFIKSIWILLRYSSGKMLEFIREWLCYNIDTDETSYNKKLNSANSIRNIFNYLLETGLKQKDLNDIEDKNILFGEGKSKELTTIIINEIKPVVKNQSAKGKMTGYACPLHQDTVTEIYNFMLTHKPKPQIKGRLKDFQNIFSNEPKQVDEPIIWLIKGQTTTGSRGNQMKLYFFLEKMLQRMPTIDDKRKAAKLFVDEKGEFFNPKMRKPKEEERSMYDSFENLLKETSQKK